MKLLALVLLFSAFSSLSLTEVVKSFTQSCPSFFMLNPKDKNKRIVPTIFPSSQYKKICQRWRNTYRFATVYNTEGRIPLYSAYTLWKKGETKRSDEWKIEPQLEDIKGYRLMREMIKSPREPGNITNQAVDSDYTGSGYTRGHVFPHHFAGDQDQADSTFTLTNVAPQTQSSNGQWAAQVEEPMLKEMTRECALDGDHRAYVVTGAVPGKTRLSIKRDDKGIRIPSHFWSAFCCTSKTDRKKLVSKAFIAELENFTVRHPSISSLNQRLTELYGQNKPFNVFPGLQL